MDNKKIIITPEEERITRDVATIYELTNAVSQRVTMINSTFDTYLDNVLINIDELNDKKKNEIKESEIINDGDNKYYRLTSSMDIAKLELNNNLSPFTVMRIISQDGNNLYVEKVAINKMSYDKFKY